MSELLQEYVDSREQRLRVDRSSGVIRGVKLLGLASRNGRRYREEALVNAVGLYEGAKVNINHPKGHPLSPRDYQDRLGVVRGVEFRSGEGLFGDLHFNPKHSLSEQLVWDAEHAPQNVGMSHNVLARTSRSGDETVVEAITKVQSIDLVADPATTNGLYEQVESLESRVKSREPEKGDSRLPLDAITLQQLREHRPDLIAELSAVHESHLAQLRSRVDELAAQEAARARRDKIAQLLKQHQLPVPSGNGAKDNAVVSRQFFESLLCEENEAKVRQLIAERAALVRSACEWGRRSRVSSPRPTSRDQLAVQDSFGVRPASTAQEFAAAIRG